MDALGLVAILTQILIVDLVLAGDNAIIIGLAVARLSAEQRNRAVLIGVIGATVIRFLFALVAMKLLAIIGLTLAGGILLLWVIWKSIREFTAPEKAGENGLGAPASMGAAIWKIILADVSMSLDNVLAVAGAARNHQILLGLGLVVSVGLMGLAATAVAHIMHRYQWVVWVGILIMLYIAASMIWEGWHEVAPFLPLKM